MHSTTLGAVVVVSFVRVISTLKATQNATSNPEWNYSTDSEMEPVCNWHIKCKTAIWCG
ncbi:hypothetical protein KC19_2G236600 [Ceratodon purpureus]|uniref:Uncharacterized protein n=1 Tax=Ceratodon purpureus TaxID=3225 RepID=A0A8T0J040_CERPU|nr:hypothetical protein KC19_2G236600 [Ceratodon purpureus]